MGNSGIHCLAVAGRDRLAPEHFVVVSSAGRAKGNQGNGHVGVGGLMRTTPSTAPSPPPSFHFSFLLSSLLCSACHQGNYHYFSVRYPQAKSLHLIVVARPSEPPLSASPPPSALCAATRRPPSPAFSRSHHFLQASTYPVYTPLITQYS